MDRHRAYLLAGPLAERERERARQEVLALLGETLLERQLAALGGGELAAAVARVAGRESHPRREAQRLAAALGAPAKKEATQP
jgi:hypothetical protein